MVYYIILYDIVLWYILYSIYKTGLSTSQDLANLSRPAGWKAPIATCLCFTRPEIIGLHCLSYLAFSHGFWGTKL